MATKLQCSESIYDSYTMRFHRCSRSGSIERDGKHYCKRHDPVAIAEKRKAKKEKDDQKWNANCAKWRLDGAAPKLLAACKSAASLLRRLGGTNHDPEYTELLEAIAEAEGKK
jgi:hypothetical protein